MSKWSQILSNIVLLVLSLFSENITVMISLLYVQIAVNSFFLIKGNSKFVSIGLVFFLLLSLFNFGSFLTIGSDAFDKFDQGITFAALKFAYACVSCFCIGYIAKRNVLIDCSKMDIELNTFNIGLLKKVARTTLVISLPFLLYIDYMRVTHTMAEGYGGIYSMGGTNPIIKYGGIISLLARPSVLFLMICNHNNIKKARLILFIFVTYSLLTMISGARITATTYILTFVLFYVKIFVKKLSIKNLVLFGAFAAFMVVFLPAISSYRSGGEIDSFSMHSESVQESGGSSVAFASEFGDSFDVVILVFMFLHNHNFGLTYIVSLLAISPKIPEILFPITSTNFSFVTMFPESAQMYLGGSCIAEAYYNFGLFAPLFFILIGYLVCRIDENLTKLSIKNIFTCILSISLVPCLITWIRDFFICFMGEGFWIPFVYRIYLKKRIKR